MVVSFNNLKGKGVHGNRDFSVELEQVNGNNESCYDVLRLRTRPNRLTITQ